jgi:hypothetical protein
MLMLAFFYDGGEQNHRGVPDLSLDVPAVLLSANLFTAASSSLSIPPVRGAVVAGLLMSGVPVFVSQEESCT